MSVTEQQLHAALVAGKLTATFVAGDEGHLTVTFKGWRPGAGARIVALDEADRVYVRGSGRDRVGMIALTGPRAGQLIADRFADPQRVVAAQYIFDAARGRGPADGILPSRFCLRCGAPLGDPISIGRNMGPDCYGSATGAKALLRQRGFVWPTPVAEPSAAEAVQTIPDLTVADDDTLICDFGGYDPTRLNAFKSAVGYKRRRFDAATKRWDVTPNRKDAQALLQLAGDGVLICDERATRRLHELRG